MSGAVLENRVYIQFNKCPVLHQTGVFVRRAILVKTITVPNMNANSVYIENEFFKKVPADVRVTMHLKENL